MSVVVPHFDDPAIVTGASAKVLGAPNVKVTLLGDSSATGGALSTVRVALKKGADGACPHRHEKSAEMFYILDGGVQVLAGEDVVTAEAGDVIVVPPRLPHACAARRTSGRREQ